MASWKKEPSMDAMVPTRTCTSQGVAAQAAQAVEQ